MCPSLGFSSMETAILVRHGESEASVRGLVSGEPTTACPLTAVGRRQARKLGLLLAKKDIDVCVTSEFPRTIETADLALDGRDIRRVVIPELNDPRAGAFCHGDTPGLADIALVPQVYNAHRYPLDLTVYPTIMRIYQNCKALDAFAAADPDHQPDREP